MTIPASVSDSYMEMCVHVDGGQNLYLRIPTVWDETEKGWIGFIKTPKTQKLISAKGKESFELQNNFNLAFKNAFEFNKEISEEIFSMFQPLSYWDEMEEK